MKFKKITLASLQNQFSSALQGNKSAYKKTLANLNATNTFSTKMRFGVYDYAYFARLLESLEEDFPMTQKYLGKRAFQKLVKSYVTTLPSRSWTLNDLGSRLHGFVRRTAPYKKQMRLHELVKLEWLKMILANEPAPTPFDLKLLMTSAGQPRPATEVTLKLNPHVYFLKYNAKPCLLIPHGGSVELYEFSQKENLIFQRWLKECKKNRNIKTLTLAKLAKILQQVKLTTHDAEKIFSMWVQNKIVC